jgi:hypothetical protein
VKILNKDMELDHYYCSPVQAFQKLIYVSTLVFGEASSFLLPWKRVFKVTDSQVFFFYQLFLFLAYVHLFFVDNIFSFLPPVAYLLSCYLYFVKS